MKEVEVILLFLEGSRTIHSMYWFYVNFYQVRQAFPTRFITDGGLHTWRVITYVRVSRLFALTRGAILCHSRLLYLTDNLTMRASESHQIEL